MTKKNNQPLSENPHYSPTPQEQAVIEKALATRRAAPATRLRVEKKEIAIDHPDRRVGQLLLDSALGSRSESFTDGLLVQVANTVQRAGKDGESDLNFMVEFIKGIEPRDQLESVLATEMAAVHMEMMRIAGQFGSIKLLVERDSALRGINQLARTFAAQMEALKRYRTGGEQKITVQRVLVSEGGQAIVGNVTQAPRKLAAVQSSSPALPSHSRTVEIGASEHSSAAPKRSRR